MFDRLFHDNIYHDAQALISSTKADLRSWGLGSMESPLLLAPPPHHFQWSTPLLMPL